MREAATEAVCRGDRLPDTRDGSKSRIWRSPRTSKGQTSRYTSEDMMMLCHSIATVALTIEPFELRSYDEANASASWTQWRDAMDEEVKSLRLNETCILQPTSSVTANGKHVLRGNWVKKSRQQRMTACKAQSTVGCPRLRTCRGQRLRRDVRSSRHAYELQSTFRNYSRHGLRD